MIGQDKQRHIHKVLTRILTIWLVVFLVFGGLAVSTPTRAFVDIFQSIYNIFDIPFQIVDKVYRRLNDVYQKLGNIGFKEAARKMLNNMAKDTATFLVTGDKGKAPMFQTNFGEYLKNEGDAFLGDAFNNQFQKEWGASLCEPLNPVMKVNIQLTAKNIMTEQKPSCTFSKMWKNISSLKDTKLVQLPQFADIFNPNANDLGIIMTVTTKFDQGKRTKVEMEKLEQMITEGIKSIKSPISGKIKTPSWMVKLMAEEPLLESFRKDLTHTGTLAADFIGPFANTLAGQLYKKWQKGLLPDTPTNTVGGGGGGGSYAPGYGTQADIEQLAQSGIGELDYSYGGMLDLLDKLSCDTENQFSCTIDPDLRRAIEQKMTVGEALDKGALHGGWAFGYRADKTGGTDNAKSGSIYSFRSLVILRKYRIIPVTWELAAEYYYKFDKTGKDLTLDLLTSKEYFDNPDSPYYRLVDKGWVLKAPDTICEKEGPGEEVLEVVDMSADINGNQIIDEEERKEMVVRGENYCADERSCVGESLDGTSCLFFGYCTKEKGIWRIESGACEPKYNSCQTFSKRDGTVVSYLKNTLTGRDFGCDENAVGCREYCASIDPVSGGWACFFGQDNSTRIYLNKSVEGSECDDDEAGCNKYIRMSSSIKQPSNWITNSSFEFSSYNDNKFHPDIYNSNFVTWSGTGDMVSGIKGKALKLGSNLNININTRETLEGRSFIFSLDSDNDNLQASSNNSGVKTEQLGRVSLGGGFYRLSWKYQFERNNPSVGSEIKIGIDGSGANIVDNLQLIESGEDKDYREYGSINIVNLRKPPAEYECKEYIKVKEESTKTTCESAGYVWRDDFNRCVEGGNIKCKEYSAYCSEEDMDCRFYDPVSYAGSKQPGVIRDNDFCPKECVGYKSYLEQPTFFIPLATSAPVNFIASTARACTALDNGCEEFTNLSEGVEGEQKEYYSILRACVLPDPNNTDIGDYYSWVSGDESGNQLRKWTLLRSNEGDFPCTNTTTDAGGQVMCSDSATNIHLCILGDPDPDKNPALNPDCVEFTNTSGEAKWVKFSKIVFVSEECTKYRRTNIVPGEAGQRIYSAIPSLSQTCSSSAVGCREYKGSNSNNINEVLESDFEDNTNQSWVGGSVSNESIIANGYSLFTSSGSIYREIRGLLHKNSSYKISFWAKSKVAGTNKLQVNFSSDKIFGGQADLNDYWNKYVFDLKNLDRDPKSDEKLKIEAGAGFYIDNIILTETNGDLYIVKDSWQTPASCDSPAVGEMLGCESYRDSDGEEKYAKSFSKICYDFSVGCEALIDTFNSDVPYELEYNKDNFDSRDNVRVPRDELVYMVYDKEKTCQLPGCTRLGLMSLEPSIAKINFANRNILLNPNIYNSQMSPLCKSSSVGCEEFEEVGQKANSRVYFKDPGQLVCDYRAVGGNYGWYKVGNNEPCPGANLSRGFGSPTIFNGYCVGDNTISCGIDSDCGSKGPCAGYGYCSNEPSKVCKEDSNCVASAPCILDRHCIGGRTKDEASDNNSCLQNSGTAGCIDYSTGKEGGICSSWVALCPEDMSSCTEYQDPNTPEGCNKEAVNFEYTTNPDPTRGPIPYCDFYYYKSNLVETCASVDPKAGCLGFHQTDGGEDYWYSVPRCSGKPEIRCESDSDCSESGKNWGRCTYITQ